MRVRRLGNFVSAAVVSASTLLNVAMVPLASAVTDTCTWTGGGAADNFNNALNWNCSTDGAAVPENGDSLVFDSNTLSASTTVSNDLSSLTLGGVSFVNTGTGYYNYTIEGNALSASNYTASVYAVISAPITLSGSTIINTPTNGYLYVEGVVDGTGSITKSGTGGVSLRGNNTFTGSVTVNGGSITGSKASSLGAAANAVSINDGANLGIGSCDVGFTFANDITLTGASSQPSGEYPIPKLTVGGVCAGGGADEYYGAISSNQEFTLSGDITLGSDITFGALAQKTNLTGSLSGAHKFTIPSVYAGVVNVAANPNTSGAPNGTYQTDVVTTTLSDSQPDNTVIVSDRAIVILDGARGDVNVSTGGTLKGTGTTKVLSVGAGATVAPGHSPGCLSTNDLLMSGKYEFELKGSTACTDHDQIKVTGTVDLDATTAELSTVILPGYTATAGQKYVIVSNDGTDAVTGTFKGLAEGATFMLGNGQFRISYVGGDGNDVELTVLTVPSAPDTGFMLLSANPALSAVVAVVGAGALLFMARRVRA